MCRKRKIKCDGKQASTGRCTNCNTHEWDCVFNSNLNKRYETGYVEALEVKVKKLEGLIKRLLPDQDFTQEVGYELTRDNWMLPGACGTSPSNVSRAYNSSSSETGVMSAPSVSTPSSFAVLGPEQAPPMTPVPEDDHSSDEGNNITIKLQSLPSVTVTRPRDLTNYLGKSSAAGLIKTAFALCSKLAPNVDTTAVFRMIGRRPSWQENFMNEGAPTSLSFPEQDLLDDLIKGYFFDVHMFAPVLHRPTFEADVKSGLHLRDREFGGLVLLVCALAARFSHDRRVLVDSDGEDNWHSAGWKYFTQVRLYSESHIATPGSHLCGLQTICLGVMYSVSVSSVHAWIHAALGVRLALDIGAHKRRAYGTMPSVEDELYKRAFWTLVFFDRTLSGSMGRPSSIQEEDFDLELPLCCDDEYLGADQQGKQPEDKPSNASYFVWMLKLSQIQGLALRTIYASTKARAHYNFQGEDWITRTIAQLDSLLNNWANSVPEHLRWDPSRTDDLFFCQSAHLWMQYHEAQIMVHRQFISSIQITPMPFPALTICTSAARSLVHLTVSLYTRLPDRTGVLHWGAGYAGLVLLVGIGNARLHNLAYDRKSAMADIETMLRILRSQENRWRWASRHADVLEVLKAIGEDDNYEPVKYRKRRHGEDPPPNTDLYFSRFLPPEDRVQNATSTVDWNAPSIFGTVSTTQSAAGATHLPDVSHSQDAGVLGNVDFGALFGFGNTTTSHAQSSPNPLVSDMDAFDGFAPGDQHMGSSQLGDWAGIPFDLGMDDWQWMLPGPVPEQAAYTVYQAFPGEHGETEHR
ncbi:hypothetical protein PENSPDRAFT_618879 [Peniophora sp. CONT]|nr:hypothetical protein PENSPDRAFT_618879 [Peniophora sp. CONT]